MDHGDFLASQPDGAAPGPKRALAARASARLLGFEKVARAPPRRRRRAGIPLSPGPRRYRNLVYRRRGEVRRKRCMSCTPFRRPTRVTMPRDLETAGVRYREMLNRRGNEAVKPCPNLNHITPAAGNVVESVHHACWPRLPTTNERQARFRLNQSTCNPTAQSKRNRLISAHPRCRARNGPTPPAPC